MARIKRYWGVLEPPWVWLTAVYHHGGRPWEADCRHYIWACHFEDVPEPPGGMAIHTTLASAQLEAKTWAAMPMVPRDICVYCRLLAMGPNWPRWNIYRGEDRMAVPMTIHGLPP